jgi:hypothetical protein
MCGAAWGAGGGIDPNRGFAMTDAKGEVLQGGAPDPLLTATITDGLSHTEALYPNIIWFSLVFQGTGSCYVRLMDTTAKGTHSAVLVSSEYSRVVHKNAAYINYSGAGCSGSVLEKMGK